VTTLEPAAVADLVRSTLSAHQSMFLATSGSAGPWVGGVYFAESGEFTLNLVLEDRGRTLAAIRENPANVANDSCGTCGDAVGEFGRVC
jgi:hypothetical protein